MKTVILISLFAIVVSYSNAQHLKATKCFEYYRQNYAIVAPVFAHNNNEIVFSNQFIIPDGGEALGNEAYVKSLLQRAKKEKRFADPVVTILNLKTKELVPINYGWTPSFSKDDKLIFYSYQTRPITGYRALSSTLKGNSIRMYNRTNKKDEVIAIPQNSSFMQPMVVDDKNIAYTVGLPVNGSYMGSAGLHKLNLTSRHISVIAAPQKQVNGTFPGNYAPIDEIKTLGNQLVYTRENKLMGPKGVILKIRSTYQQIGIDKNKHLWVLEGGSYKKYDRNYLIEYNSAGRQISKKHIKFTFDEDHAYLSPSGGYLFYYDYKSHFCLRNLHTNEKSNMNLPDRVVQSVSWSQDMKKVAIIQEHEKFGFTDKLMIFNIEDK